MRPSDRSVESGMTSKPKRPSDPAQLMIDIATGEVEDRAPRRRV
jgi:hypothetical protein